MDDDTRGTLSIGAWVIDDRRVPVRTYAEGRRCQKPGCTTRLSIYNDGSHCARHPVPQTVRIARRQGGLRPLVVTFGPGHRRSGL